MRHISLNLKYMYKNVNTKRQRKDDIFSFRNFLTKSIGLNVFLVQSWIEKWIEKCVYFSYR